MELCIENSASTMKFREFAPFLSSGCKSLSISNFAANGLLQASAIYWEILIIGRIGASSIGKNDGIA